ncbi:MAG TPA: methyltransferase domain-containing protein [Nocardioides sp.]
MSQDGTTSVDYGQDYYNEAHLGGHGDYSWDNEHWRNFFMSVADRLIGAFNPGSVLDVGCARGLLVQSFTVQGVEAWGLDISAHAIASAHEEVRDRLRVASATDPIEGRYDLVTCIEVLEHMSEADAQRAIDHLTAVTDRVLFSSSPVDHDEPTHINTNPGEAWAAWFAERGFFRRTDVDVSMIAPWAVVFERRVPTLHELVKGYEQQYARTRTELLEKRRALLEADRQINALRGQLDERPVDTEEVDRLRAEVAQHRHASLVSRDHVIGLEAENGRLERDLSLVMLELRKLQRRVKGLTKRREELTANLRETRQRLERNRKRVAQLEAAPAPQASLTRRVARRVRRTFA